MYSHKSVLGSTFHSHFKNGKKQRTLNRNAVEKTTTLNSSYNNATIDCYSVESLQQYYQQYFNVALPVYESN